MRRLISICSAALLLCMCGGWLLLPHPARAQPEAATETNATAAYWFIRSLELLEEGLYEEVLEICEQAIKIDPDVAGAHLLKGATLAILERHEEALQAYEQAIKIDPQLADALTR